MSVLEGLIEKYQELKANTELEHQTHHAIYRDFIEPLLTDMGWKELKPQSLGNYQRLILNPDELTFFILGGDFERHYDFTSRIAQQCGGISAVTNFDKCIIFFRDNAGVKQLQSLSVEGYLNNVKILQQLFSKESIESGDYRHYISEKLKSDFDNDFFDLLLSFRKEIAEGIWAEENNRILLRDTYGENLQTELNKLVQIIVDRFLLYRFAEDNQVIPDVYSIRQVLFNFQTHTRRMMGNMWDEILTLFERFRKGYNGKIFDKGKSDEITLRDAFLVEFLKKLCGVGFEEHRIEILGHIYEKYLGERVYIEGDKIRLDKTPEARKAGGIYYTPSYITKYIVDNTLGVMLGELEDKLEEVKESGDIDALTEILAQSTDIKILDPACGSGAFLIQALKLLRDFYKTYSEVADGVRKLNFRTDNLIDSSELTDKIDPIVYGNDRKSVRLSKAPGYYALQNNIYGVDIDERAVEVTAVSLMMQILDEVKDAPGLKFPAIMEENIKCGNSLISGVRDRKELEEDFKEEIGELIALRKQHKSETDSEKKIWISHTLFNKKRVINLKLNSKLSEYFDDVNAKKPFNWEIEFPEVFFNEDGSLKENPGFDCVVGNPPYIKASVVLPWEETQELMEMRRAIENCGFETLSGRWDFYIAFMERGFQLLRNGGVESMIVANSLNTAPYASKIRQKFIAESQILKLDFFQDVEIFEGVGIRNTIFRVIKMNPNPKIYIARWLHKALDENSRVELTSLGQLTYGDKAFNPFFSPQKVEVKFVPLGLLCYICGGAQLQSDQEKFRGEFTKDYLIRNIRVLNSDKPYLEGKNIGRYYYTSLRFLDYDSHVEKMKRPRFRELFESEKIMVGATSGAIFDSTGIYVNHSVILCVRWCDLSGVNNNSINKGLKLLENLFRDYEIIRNDLENLSESYSSVFLLAIVSSLWARDFCRRNARAKIGLTEDTLKILPIRRIDFTNPTEKSQHDELAALADKMLHLNKRLHNELEQLTFLQVCDEINPNRLPLKGMGQPPTPFVKGDRFRIVITGSKRKKLTSQVIESFEMKDGELRLKDGDLTVRIQADETALSFLRTYLAHIDNETLDTLNAEYPKLEDKIRNIPVPDLTIEEMLQALSRWEGIEKEKESLAKEIQDTDNLIDAKVFRLYGLEREEIITVLDSLGTDEEIKADIQLLIKIIGSR